MNLRDRWKQLSKGELAFLEWQGLLENPPGFVYFDLPKLTAEQLDEFKAIVGRENIQWLTFNAVSNRGQMFLTLEGKANFDNYMKGEQ